MELWYKKFGWEHDPFSVRPSEKLVGLSKEINEVIADCPDLEIILTLEELFPAYYGHEGYGRQGTVTLSLPSIWRYAGGQTDYFMSLFRRLLCHEILHHLIKKEGIKI